MTELPKPATLKAVTFLQSWPHYPVLSAKFVNPQTGAESPGFPTIAFPPDANGQVNWGAVHAWIEKHQGKANIYFLVNTPIKPEHKKSDRENIKDVVAWHVDIDVRVGENQDEGIARIVAQLEKYDPPPSTIIVSGGGAQAFWRGSAPLAVNGSVAIADELAAYNKKIERDLGGDNCHNVDRIMRLPGTVNIPKTEKMKKGRVAKTAYVHFNDSARTYDLTTFPKIAEKKVEAETESFTFDDKIATVPDEIARIIRQGYGAATGGLTKGQNDFKIVAALVRAGLTDDEIKTVYRQSPLSRDADEWARGFEGDMNRLIERAREKIRDPEIDAFNKKHMEIMIEGKPRIGTWKKSRRFPGQRELKLSTHDEMKVWYQNKRKLAEVPVRDEAGNPTGEMKKKSQAFFDYWLKHPDHARYDDLIFSPDAPATDGAYNMWEGFTVEPRPGSWDKFKAHIHDNLCSGNAVYSAYLYRWMAFIVQKRRQTGIAIVLRSDEEGTGKGFFALKFGQLFGPHFMQVTNPEHVVGKFNPHLQTLLVLNADEALFAGDHRHRNALWSLISEPTLTIERKNYNAFQDLNYLNIIITTNSKHAVDVQRTARRVFALNVAPFQMQNLTYFQAISAELEAGGYAAMLHDLMTLDLTGFDPKDFPRTDALNEQMAYSRNGVDHLVEDVCSHGVVPCAHPKHPEISITVGEHGFDAQIDKHPDRAVSRLQHTRVKALLRDDWGCVPGKVYWLHNLSTRGLEWPPLADLRAKFVEKFGPQTWLAPDLTEWQTAEPGAATKRPNDREIPF